MFNPNEQIIQSLKGQPDAINAMFAVPHAQLQQMSSLAPGNPLLQMQGMRGGWVPRLPGK